MSFDWHWRQALFRVGQRVAPRPASSRLEQRYSLEATRSALGKARALDTVRPDVFAAVALVAVALISLYPVLGARFVLVDDHEILRNTQPGAAPALTSFWGAVLSNDPAIGRFRPMYWLLRLTQMTVLGDNSFAWHVVTLGEGIATALLLYTAWRGLGSNRPLAWLVGVWLLVAPGVASAWVRLGPNETSGMLFLGVALWAATRAARTAHSAAAWDALFVFSAAAALLSKESFILTAPAVALFRVLAAFSASDQLKKPLSALCVLVLGVLFAFVEVLTGRGAGINSYGGSYLAPPDPQVFAGNVAHNVAILLYAGVGWLGLVAVWRFRRQRLSYRNRMTLLLAAGVATLLVVPQVLVYSNQGILEGRYELPAALGVVGLVTAAIAWLGQRGSTRLYPAAVVLLATTLTAFCLSTWTYASFFAEDSVQLQRLVGEVAAHTPQGSIVGIAADPARQYEPVLALVAHLAHYGQVSQRVELLPLSSAVPPYTVREELLVHALRETRLMQSPRLSETGCAQLGALIVLGDEELTLDALPCLKGFRRQEFSAFVALWGGEAVSLRPRLPGVGGISYVVLVPRATK